MDPRAYPPLLFSVPPSAAGRAGRAHGLPGTISSVRGLALLACALLLVFPGRAPLWAEDMPPGAADSGPPPPALTALEAGPFREADLVVLARVIETRNVRSPGGTGGQQLVRARVEETLQGTAPRTEEISVMVLGQRPTLNPDQPSVPYFPPNTRELYVLFLGKQPGRFAYRLQTLFEGGGRVGAEKIAVSRAVAKLSRIEDVDEKGRRTLAALIAMSKGAGRWTKAFAGREMNYLARVRPQVFDERARNRLRRIPAVTMTADQRFWMKRLFEQLAPSEQGGRGDRPQPEEDASDPWRVTFLAAADTEAQKMMLIRLLAGPEGALGRHAGWAWARIGPSLRRWYARAVAESRKKSEKVQLRRRYAGEEDPEVRAAIIRTVGLLGEAEDVDWLAERARNLELRRPALLALARIDLPAARARLEAAGAAAETAGQKDLAAWVAHLLGPTFAESERRAGRR